MPSCRPIRAARTPNRLDWTIADYPEERRLGSKDLVAFNNRGDASKGAGDLDRAMADRLDASP